MSIDKLLRRAIDQHNNREYEEAARLYSKILSGKPRHLDANYLLGTLYAECGDCEKAKKYLERAAQIDPRSPMVQVNLGNVYRQAGEPELAVKSFTRARQAMPNLYQAHLGLGSVLLQLDQDLEMASACLREALSLAPEVPEIYYQIGLLSKKLGKLDEALELLESARDMNPNIPGIDAEIGAVYSGIGLTFLKKGDNEKAAGYFREACRLSPDNINGILFLEIAEGRTPSVEMMKKYSQFVFDDYAPRFEQHLVEKLHYNLPFQVLDTLRQICGNECRFESIIDLGCGTGLTGEALRSVAHHLTGVDISEKMIAHARGKNCFDQLYCGDLVTTLTEQESRYDLFVATDVLVYIGTMDELMAAVVSRALPGALLLFSTEKSAGEGLMLQKSGRYAHSPEYVHDVVKAHGCAVVSETVIDLRQEEASWIKGSLFVVRLPGW